MTDKPIKLFAGRASIEIATKIAESFGTTLGKVSIQEFSDGEFQPSFDETVRGAHVIIVQSTFQPTDNLFELLLMIDAAKRASAYKIMAVIPYFGFARQDRKDKPRVSIGSKLVADLLSAAGVSRVITLDLHADQIQGFFNVPVDHLYASSIFVPYIKNLNLKNLVLAAPDMGGTKRTNAYAKFFHSEMVICHKSRKKANEIGDMTIIGDVSGKNIIILDDMIDTAGTITKAADMMMKKGALTVRVIATHPVLSGPAYDRINNSQITEVVVSDSIPIDHKKSNKIKVISVADVFSDVIKKGYQYKSISSNFII
ncbi:MAG: ribose-phosphate pyrophosphokinase [Chlorobi bacterium]|nr:ribose-phosphate pyrophosphokinase [Chlorobiota bacterium]